MPTVRGKSLVVGDTVDVLDTSNQKTLEAFVRQIDGQKVQVYVTRFKTMMWFDAGGVTPKGRFKLGNRRVR